MNTLGLIGCGRIGGSLIEALQSGRVGGWQVAGILARTARTLAGLDVECERQAFFARPYDLIIEVAGPQALRELGAQALRQAPVWTVSAVALADPATRQELLDAGVAHGHALRIVPGAIAGIDALKAAAIDPQCRLQVEVQMPAGSPGKVPFSGTAAEAAQQFPNQVNVAVAAALAGTGLDRTNVHIHRHSGAGPRTISLTATSRHVQVTGTFSPSDDPDGCHPVAAALIAALLEYGSPLTVG